MIGITVWGWVNPSRVNEMCGIQKFAFPVTKNITKIPKLIHKCAKIRCVKRWSNWWTCFLKFCFACLHLEEILIFFCIRYLHLVWRIHVYGCKNATSSSKRPMHLPQELAKMSPTSVLSSVVTPHTFNFSSTFSIFHCKNWWKELFHQPNPNRREINIILVCSI